METQFRIFGTYSNGHLDRHKFREVVYDYKVKVSSWELGNFSNLFETNLNKKIDYGELIIHKESVVKYALQLVEDHLISLAYYKKFRWTKFYLFLFKITIIIEKEIFIHIVHMK